jgi:hypothetical protein
MLLKTAGVLIGMEVWSLEFGAGLAFLEVFILFPVDFP